MLDTDIRLARGIRYLSDQNSLTNPGPLMHLNMLYSNRKNCKILASETILVYEMKWPSVTGAEVIGTYYVNNFLFISIFIENNR